MCDVSSFVETRVYGAKGDNANDTEYDDDGALEKCEEKGKKERKKEALHRYRCW